MTYEQLNYNSPVTHFVERHILDNDPRWASRSKYQFSGDVGSRLTREPDPNKRLQIAKDAVIALDNITFTFGGRYQNNPRANIVFVFGFPWGSGPYFDFEFLVGDVGGGNKNVLTNVNTLILANDCRTVITSYPGTPNGAHNYRGSPPIRRQFMGFFF